MDREQLQRSIEERLRRLSLLLYDTKVPAAVVDAEVAPHLAPRVRFTNPWQEASGRAKYRLGLAGFHGLLRFDLELAQVSLQLDVGGRSGRALADGVMHLRFPAPLPSFPLRTILVYEVRVTDPKKGGFVITSQEEMWSAADLLAAVPWVGQLYTRWFRPGFAWGFLAASWLSGRVRGKLDVGGA